MKKVIKNLAICGGITASLAGVTGLVIVSNASAETVDTTFSNLAPVVSELASVKNISATKDETVYLMATASGTVNKKFVGSTLYTGSEGAPFTLDIKYYLDNTEISPSSLAGKSGHVKILYSFAATRTYQGKQVPFLAATGLMLDGDSFTNVRIDHGKVLDDGTRATVVGYALPGVNADLGTDFLNSTFTIEADTTSFALPVSYTLVTNELFAELDTSRLSEVDGLVSSINQLSDGLDQLIAGTSTLSDGLKSALSGATELQAGADKLADGAASALNGANTLYGYLTELTSNNDRLTTGATTVTTSTLTSLGNNASVQAIISYLRYTGATTESAVTVDNYETLLPLVIQTATAQGATTEQLADLQSAYGLLQLSTGIIGYTSGAASITAGVPELTSGLTELSAGVTELSTGLGTLVSGQSELYQGSVTLLDGLNTFKDSGISKLVNFANQDLTTFTRNARATVSAAQSYRHFSQSDATSVKFIVKTAGI